MELRAYWSFIKRRWLLILIPAAVVLAVALITYSPPAPAYNAGVRFIAAQEPSEAAVLSDEERLANWQTSEYIVNTLTEWVRGGQFAELVSQTMAEQGRDIPPASVQGTISSDNARSVLVLYVTAGAPASVEQILNAAAETLIAHNDLGLPQLGGERAELVQLDEPIVNPVPAGILDQMELPLRILIALVAGVGLALLVEYLDPTVRDRQQLETMGLPVVGEIPRGKA